MHSCRHVGSGLQLSSRLQRKFILLVDDGHSKNTRIFLTKEVEKETDPRSDAKKNKDYKARIFASHQEVFQSQHGWVQRQKFVATGHRSEL